MVWPTITVDTSQMDADGDNPRLARPSFKQIADFVNLIAVGDTAARALLGVPSTAEMNTAITAGVNDAKAYTDGKYYPLRRQTIVSGGIAKDALGYFLEWYGGITYANGSTDSYEVQFANYLIGSLGAEKKKYYVYKEKASATLKVTEYPPIYFSSRAGTAGTPMYDIPGSAYLDQISFSWILNFENLSTSMTGTSEPGSEEFGHYNDIFNTGQYDMRISAVGAGSGAYYGDTSVYKFGTRSLKITANNIALELSPSRRQMPQGSWIMEGWFNFSTLPGSGTGKTLFAVENRAATFDVAKLRLENASGVLKLKAYLSSDGATYDIVNGGTGSGTTFVAGQWYHIGLRYNDIDDTYIIMFNGSKDYVLSASAKKVFKQINKIRVANDRTVGTSGFLGNIDGLCILPCAKYSVVGSAYTVPAAAPSAEGCDLYDYSTDVMAWKHGATQRAYVGELFVNGLIGSPAVSSYAPYARAEYAVSEIAVSTNYAFTHNIGFPVMSVQIMGQKSAEGGYGQVVQQIQVGDLTTTTGTIRIGSTPQIIDPALSANSTPTIVKVILDRGW